MAFERPTFHEAWYRVEEMHPRLRSTVQITRQHFRGQSWHVVQDHTNNAFFRLSEPAYRFIGLLDGQRSVGDAWKICMEQLGDDAPTQGEAIQLLGQLYTSNLLQGELAADTHGLFNRYNQRRQREVKNYLMNLMFIRIPIFDPDSFMERWMPLVSWVFSYVGLIVWLILISIAAWSISTVPHWMDALWKGGRTVLDPNNLIPLYIGFALIKACHEFGHAISCKKFGMRGGTGGEVHVMGIMFLIFSPVPYVDASSSWALRSKWERMIVGFAGMWVELAIASIAAMVWAYTGEGGVHQLAYNIMFVASVSTLLFNANPLLRYDGYYMLSDLLEIPNLAQRGKEFIYYLVKRYAWGVKQARNPAHTMGEQIWLFCYAIASFIMRVIVSFGIMFYLASVLDGALVIIATAMAIAGIVTWVFVPIGKFIHYLATSQELFRVRPRAVSTTLIALALVITAVGLIPFPDRARAQGVVEPTKDALQEVSAGWEGKILSTLHDAPSDRLYGTPFVTKGTVIAQADSPELQMEIKQLEAEKERVEKKWAQALQAGEHAVAQAWLTMLDTQKELLHNAHQRQDSLTVKAPFDGVLISPDLHQQRGRFIKHGEKIALVADMSQLVIWVSAPNEIAGPLREEANKKVEIRVLDRPDILLSGEIEFVLPAGQKHLRSPALGFAAGGNMQVASDDRNGTKTTEPFFELRIGKLQLVSAPPDIKAQYDQTGQLPLYILQRVMVRFDLEQKPLISQAWTSLMQLIQKRFQT